MARPTTPDAKAKAAAFLVATNQAGSPSPEPKSKRRKKNEKPLKLPVPSVPDSEKLKLQLATRPGVVDTTKKYPVNLGPNPSGYVPKPFGLLDFRDIALFLWPPWRVRRELDLEEQCLILKHRNSRLRDLTVEELVEVQQWMDESEIITVEGNNVDIREWRVWLSVKELRSLIGRMDSDLNRARSIMAYMWPERTNEHSKVYKQSKEFAAMRIVPDDEH